MSDQVEIVDPVTVRGWVDAGEAVLVDVRELQEYAAEHIRGALFNPLSTFAPAQVPNPSDKRLVIHCNSGVRCGMAAARLVETGWSGKIHRMQGGIQGWKATGGPTERGL